MNARLLAAFLCLASASTGCIIIDHDDDPCCGSTPTPTPTPTQPGDVTFLWKFGQDSCADMAHVKNVRISIPEETLHNGGVYACHTSGSDGIVLRDFRPGTYAYTLEALGYTNELLYTVTGNFTVNGNVTVSADFGNVDSSVYLSWYFRSSSGQTGACSTAGVTYLEYSIDGSAWQRLDCSVGTSGRAVRLPHLTQGTHALYLVARGSDNKAYYYTSQNVTVQAGSPVSVEYGLDSVGGVSLRWQFYDGATPRDCAETGVTQVAIHIYSYATKSYITPESGELHACTDAPIVYELLAPGNYSVYMYAAGSNDRQYDNDVERLAVTVQEFRQVQDRVAEAYTANLTRF